jgi:hypothetical protein
MMMSALHPGNFMLLRFSIHQFSITDRRNFMGFLCSFYPGKGMNERRHHHHQCKKEQTGTVSLAF